MSPNILSDRDINTSLPNAHNPAATTGEDIKSMEYHRQILQSRLAEEGQKVTYISPSDNIMSPTTAKLAGMRNKRFMKAKPQSLFAKTSAKNMSANQASSDAHSSLEGDVQKSVAGERGGVENA